MYLETLTVSGVRILADQTFRFTKPDGSPRPWTVIIADNGYCKSTILQAISLAASGPKLASELVGDSEPLRREDDEVATIDATFRVNDDASWPPRRKRKSLAVGLRAERGRHDLVPSQSTMEACTILDDVRARRLARWFVLGFGVARFLPKPGEVAAPTNPQADRVRGLFDPRHKMLATSFYEVFKQLDKKNLATNFSKELRDILVYESGGEKLLEWLHAVELRGAPGERETSRLLTARRFKLKLPGRSLEVNATALSDGYQSMVAWIADLLGHALLDVGEPTKRSQLSGVVLIDEIDLHLHPTWQHRLVPLLRDVFPKLQFIVTTHSPVVLAGFDADEIIRLELRDGLVVQDEKVGEPGLQTGSEVLANYFDTPRIARKDLVEAERNYLRLRGIKKPKASQRNMLHQLELKLGKYWENDPSRANGDDENR